MADDSDLEKTEPATARRLEKAREEGQVVRSRELSTFALLVAGFGMAYANAGPLTGHLRQMFRDAFTFDRNLAFQQARMLPKAGGMLYHGALALAPELAALYLAALLAPMALGGWLLTLKPLTPNFGRLNPIAGIGKIFSANTVVQLLMSIAKCVLVGGVAYHAILRNEDQVLQLFSEPLHEAMTHGAKLVAATVATIVGSMLVLVLADVPWQMYSHAKKLRMTKEEVKREFKESEGDPHIKGKIRQQQRAMARRRMMAKVPQADVIVTNPTHFAVALKYADDSMRAPRVIAKGMDLVARAHPRDRRRAQDSDARSAAARACAVSQRRTQPRNPRRALRRGRRKCSPGCSSCAAGTPRAARARPRLPRRSTSWCRLNSISKGASHDPAWRHAQIRPRRDRRNTKALAGPVLIVMILGMMVLPLPAFLLDLLFTFNIALSIMVLLVAMYTMQPLDFAAFPSVLLFSTLLRLSLNVASTRIVLMEGHTGPDAAGKVIEAFGHFLVGGNFAVGIVVFVILMVINFMVITKGAGRIAEVSARFTLDAMPGKQMAIDADLNAGMINEDQARKRRLAVSQEAEFYGSMDGASKFVRGDAIAGLLIMVINIVGGLIVGMAQHGMDLASAAKNYTLLTIGDGLVAQIPSLVISTAAGVIVSRVATNEDIGTQMSTSC